MSQIKGRKRDRVDQNQNPCKRERLMKLGQSEGRSSEEDDSMKLEEAAAFMGKGGGISGLSVMDQLLELMRREENDSLENWSDTVSKKIFLSTMIAATEDEECLSRFMQLDGLSVLDEWLQNAHKVNPGDQDCTDREKSLDDLILVLLNALDKLKVDLDSLGGCSVNKSVNNLRSHKNTEIQRRAGELSDNWKKHVDAMMKSTTSESKHGSDPVSATQSSGEGLDVKCQTADSNHVISNALKDDLPQVSRLTYQETLSKHNLSGGDEAIGSPTEEAETNSAPQSPSQSRSSLLIEGDGSQKDNGKCTASPRNSHCKNTSAWAHPLGSSSSLAQSAEHQTDLGGGNETSSGIDRMESSVESNKESDSKLQMESMPNLQINVLPIAVRTSVQNVSLYDEVDRGPSPTHGSTANAYAFQSARTSFDCNDENALETCREDTEKVQCVIVENDEPTCSEQVIHNQNETHVSDKPSPQAEILEKGINTKKGTNDVNVSRGIDVSASTAANEGSLEEIGNLKEEYCAPKTAATEDVNALVELDGNPNVNMATLSRDSEGVPPITKKRADIDDVLISSVCASFNDTDACLDEMKASSNQDWHKGDCMATMWKKNDQENVNGNEKMLNESKKAILNSLKSVMGKFSDVQITGEGSTRDFDVEDALEVARQVAKEIEQELDSRPKSPTQDSPNTIVSTVKMMSFNDELTVHNCSQDICSTKNEGAETSDMTSSLENEGTKQEEARETLKKSCYPADEDKYIRLDTCVQATQVQVPSQATTSASVNNDGNGSSAMARPIFDLNEGIGSDDDCNGDASASTIPVVNVHSVSDHLARHPASPGPVTAPIAVIAAATGFVPPSDLLMTRADLGWKGSAATSAFRSTEVCRENEPASGTAVKSETKHVKHNRNFNIDLNVADGRVMEEKCSMDLITHFPQDDTSSIRSTVRRMELDLNRTEETDDIMLSPVKSRELASHNMLDFDLNDGPQAEDCTREDSSQLVQDQDNSGAPLNCAMRDNASCRGRHTVDHLHSVDGFSGIRADLFYSIPATKKSNANYHNTPWNSYNNDLLLTSGTYNRTSMLYATGPAQSESAGPSIPHGRIMDVIEVSSSDSHLSWSRPTLDLNVGPDSAEFDAASMWQASSARQFSFQQGIPSEGGSDLFRPGVKQMSRQ